MYSKVNNSTLLQPHSLYYSSKAPSPRHSIAILQLDNLQAALLLENSHRSRRPRASYPGPGNPSLFPNENGPRASALALIAALGVKTLPSSRRSSARRSRRCCGAVCGRAGVAGIQRSRRRRRRPPRRQSASRDSKVPPPPPSLAWLASPPELLLPFRHPGSTAIFLFLHQCPLFM